VFGALQTGVIDGAENNPPSYVFSNHYTAAKYYSLTEHLIIPEVLAFSKRAWTALPADDQALIKKHAREAQMEERELWIKYEQTAMEKAKAAGCEIIEIADKAPFQNAVKPVWDKYGPKYQDMIKRIQEIA
jgi:TRAP-type C4-dicarboxylate transport system substrate-binding protein